MLTCLECSAKNSFISCLLLHIPKLWWSLAHPGIVGMSTLVLVILSILEQHCASCRSLAEENQSLHSQLTGLQGEIQDLKTRTEKLAAGRVAESNGLRNNIARQQRIIDQKDGIIAKLKLELSKVCIVYKLHL